MEPKPVSWRYVHIGSLVWYSVRGAWKPGEVVELGQNRAEHTRCAVKPAGGGLVIRRGVAELYTRKPELGGKDKPEVVKPVGVTAELF